MGKVEINKKQKREALLDSAYTLFTTVGFAKATILGISLRAGVGKGTFYLYFRDKEDIRDALIRRESSRVLTASMEALERSNPDASFVDGVIFIIDYIINALMEDLDRMRFIAKNLSWALLYASEGGEDSLNFQDFIKEKMDQGGVRLRNPKLLIFTLIELTNATCHNIILDGEPVSIEEYKPYLYDIIRRLIEDEML